MVDMDIKDDMAKDSNLNKDYTTLLEMWREEKQQRQALQKEIEELKASLARAKEDHQYDNLVHKKELEQLEKKYRRRINEKL